MLICRIFVALILGIAIIRPTVVLAGELEKETTSRPNAAELASLPQRSSSLQIGILYPEEGVVSVYAESLRKAVEAVQLQVELNPSLPEIEFIVDSLRNNEAENSLVMGRMVARGADAIIAPNFLSALITVSPDSFDIIPLVSKATQTPDVVVAGHHSFYNGLEGHEVIVRALRDLKYRSRLEQVVVMYDPVDPFGGVGYEVVTKALSAENRAFSTEVFDANEVDFFEKLDRIQQTSPFASVIIIGQTADVADVIIQAQEQAGTVGNIIGLVGDGNPAIYDLADKDENKRISGVAWDLDVTSSLSDLVTTEFTNDRFAAESYMVIWSLLLSLEETYPASRAGIRNSLIEYEAKNLEKSSVDVVTWFYHIANKSLKAAMIDLFPAQVRELNRLASANLQ